MATVDNTTTTEAPRVTVRLPPFWAEQPAVWFAQAEAQFSLANIRDEQTKFYYTISQLDQRYAASVADIITAPPEHNPYATHRAELVGRLSPSKEQRIHQLITVEEMGDRKPSQFLRHLRTLAPDMPEYILRTIWSSRLPPHIRTIPAGQNDCSLEAAARCADCITETALRPALASVGPSPNAALREEIEDLSRQVAALRAEQNRPRNSSRDPPPTSKDHPPNPRDPRYRTRFSHPVTRNHHTHNRSPSRDDPATTLCWYHRRFRARAQRCTSPCDYHQQGN
ncbi:hypothetical protein B7P43_G15176 [Cryptotermes secundus]|uniref:DUF7041 domain-containing protein n=1 Tax=Cryptotermes secundus TaxID=105785 RepID=A0A2J7PML8_9NEOP|nr:uncharacterized protein LOC111872986 [Cryptotermes secundus]PNF17578.1 hypothetical protein B7P43_G15176 [Cryptotermes secundus]